MQSRIDSQRVAAGSDSKKEHGMKTQRTFILVVATIMAVAALQAARTNAQGASAPTNQHRARAAQAVVDGGRQASQEEGATPVMSKPLPDFPGKEVVMLMVTLPPGYSGTVHRHNADTFATFWRVLSKWQ